MKNNQLLYGIPAKAAAFILTIVMLAMTAGCTLGAFALVEGGFYTRTTDQIKDDVYYSIGRRDAENVLEDAVFRDGDNITRLYGSGNAQYEVIDKQGNIVFSNHTPAAKEHVVDFDLMLGDYAYSYYGSAPANGDDAYKLRTYIDESFQKNDGYSLASAGVDLMYSLRVWIYVIGVASLILAIACFVFLMCSAGHRAGREELASSFVTKIPFDLFTFLVGLCVVLIVAFAFETLDMGGIGAIVVGAICALITAVLAVAYFYSFAARVKLGGLWKKTVICRVWRLIAKIWRAFWSGVKELFKGLPLIWKASLALVGISFLEFIVIVIFGGSTGELLLLWFIEKIIIIPAVMYLALTLRKLQSAGRALAEGDLSYQVDVSRMVWDFKRHGENLNNIAAGMTSAVEERLKSERLKTELITNVSHDIKTPLTSIINYSDLIGREPCENEKIKEYSAVLLRQSERLKRLIENLVEASKASTGNVEVLLAPCEVGVLLTQAVGEFEQRFEESGLELITKQPDTPVRIMADGRHMWRVFDNLINNILKYAQNGTRVYIGVEEKNGKALIYFKNISKYALDISAEELLERFVRGDRSRSTEGSGLGLSIAKSLTELQGGALNLTVDGDLFKATLSFDSI